MLLMEDNKFLDVVKTSLPLFGANVFTFKLSLSTVSVLSKLLGVTVCGVTWRAFASVWLLDTKSNEEVALNTV